MDRIDATLRNRPLSILDYSYYYDVWVFIPSLNFTRPGKITSLTFGAQQGIDDSSITLHILRINNETQRYNIVNSITIMAEQTGSQLYQLHLSPPLAFQPGDIIGYQSVGRMRFLFEDISLTRYLWYYIDYQHHDDLYHFTSDKHILISVITGEALHFFLN